MKRLLPLLLLPLLLTSCSNPDTSGGVTLSRGGGDDANEFPNGSCEGQGVNELSGERTGCGWIHVNEESHYIKPGANLTDADLTDADLRGAELEYADLNDADLSDANLSNADLHGADLSNADLYRADLSGANLSGAKGNQYTVCPNGHIRSNSGNNCGF